MSEYIDKQRTINSIVHALGIKDESYLLQSEKEIVEVIKGMPTADVRENEHGEWQYGENAVGQDGYYCSHCGRFVPWEYGKVGINFIYRFFFCPSCGAEMKRGEDEQIH